MELESLRNYLLWMIRENMSLRTAENYEDFFRYEERSYLLLIAKKLSSNF